MNKILGLFFIFLITACQNENEVPLTAELNLIVLDKNAATQTNATVTLYKNLTDWQKEQNVFLTTQTNNIGEITLDGLESDTVWIDVRKDEADNWENVVKIPLVRVRFGYLNTVYTIISDSEFGNLASANGKTWTLNTSTPNLPTCQTDNTEIYYKDKTFVIKENANICEGKTAQISGTWRFLTIENSDYLVKTYQNKIDTVQVLELSKQKFVIAKKENLQTFKLIFEPL